MRFCGWFALLLIGFATTTAAAEQPTEGVPVFVRGSHGPEVEYISGTARRALPLYCRMINGSLPLWELRAGRPLGVPLRSVSVSPMIVEEEENLLGFAL